MLLQPIFYGERLDVLIGAVRMSSTQQTNVTYSRALNHPVAASVHLARLLRDHLEPRALRFAVDI
jgi:hypothetical protein